MTIHDTLYRPEVLQYLQPKDIVSITATSETHYKEAHIGRLNDFFGEVNRTTLNASRFSPLQITDVSLNVVERLSLKLQPLIKKISSKKNESLVGRLVQEPIIQTLFLAMLEKRVCFSKLDYALFLLKKTAILEKHSIPRFVIDAFLKKSLLGASVNGEIIKQSSIQDVKKELELLFDKKEKFEEEFLQKLDVLLCFLQEYTSIYKDLASKKQDPFLCKLRSLILKIREECRENKQSMDEWGHIQALYAAIMKMEGQFNLLNGQERQKIQSDEKYNLIRIINDYTQIPTEDRTISTEKMEALLQYNGLILWQASEEQKNSKKLVLVAVRENPSAIQFAGEGALQHKEVLWTALKKKKILILAPLVGLILKKKEPHFYERLQNGEIQSEIKIICYVSELPGATYEQFRQNIVPSIRTLFR